jgi:hypothetical protein
VRRALLGIGVAASIGFFPGAAPASEAHVLRGHRVQVVAPAEWHLAHQLLSNCVDQAIAVTNAHGRIRPGAELPEHTALVLLFDDAVNAASGFPPRKTFRLAPKPGMLGGCCEMPTGAGYEFWFRDRDRHLAALVYAADRSLAEQAVGILNTLRVAPA